MMSLRNKIRRWLYGSCPGFAGAFKYYGTKVYFPRGSLMFEYACEQGIFERENVRLALRVVKPDTIYIDVGTNIGLMTLPVLTEVPGCRVISFEPSPNAFPWLERTQVNSAYANRWELVNKAVGAASGTVSFSVSAPAMGAYDGLQPTHRMPETQRIQVEITTLDEEWEKRGCPKLSLIKVDVEGGELAVLEGAVQCLHKTRPWILLEWNEVNLRAHKCPPSKLCDFANAHGYRLYSMPDLVPVFDAVDLRVRMLHTESFLLGAI